MKRIFLTGGVGFIGQFLSVEFLKRGISLVSLARSKGGISADVRADKALALVDPNFAQENFQVIEGDLDNLPNDAGNAEAIFHCAGDIRFEKKFADQILETNLEGTKKMLAFADRHNISEFHYISTAFARDFMTNGIVAEEDLRLNDFVNPYTKSKALAELEIKKWGKARTGRKVFIYAPSIVIGRNTDGLTTAMGGGWYRFMKTFAGIKDSRLTKRFFDGTNENLQLPIAVPGIVGATINVATVDYVVTLIANLFFAGVPGTFHITNGNAPEYDELLQMGLKTLGISGPSVRRNTRDTKKKTLRILQAAVSRGTRDYRPFTSWNPKFSQENCRRVLGDAFYPHPPIDQMLVNRLLNFALRCEFKKERVYEQSHLFHIPGFLGDEDDESEALCYGTA